MPSVKGLTVTSLGELPEASSTRRRHVLGLFIRLKDTAARIHFTRTRNCPLDYWYGVVGDCLRPFLIDGDAVLIDFDRQPQELDLVLAAMRYRRAGNLLGGSDSVVTREAVKQLRIVDGERLLCANDGHVHADAHEILGVVVGWYRPGWWRRPSPRKARFEPAPRRAVEGAG